jgi:hypothetical protein
MRTIQALTEVIVGQCELLLEHAEPDSECAEGLQDIREIAQSMAIQINGHEYRMISQN